jgi:tRNA A37 threonylcarbamoyladenosine synthetase subunit TsaC/SUA5/YrdC
VKMRPDLIIDAGNLKRSLPSTIIDLTSPEIKILREGAVKIKWN